MSLNNAALLEGATMNAATGGTALQFSSLGNTFGQNTLIVAADTTLNLRRSINASVSAPRAQPSAPNGYTQARQTLRFSVPKLLANGNITVNTSEMKMSTDVATTQAEKQEMLNLAGQACIDTDFTEFFINQVIV